MKEVKNILEIDGIAFLKSFTDMPCKCLCTLHLNYLSDELKVFRRVELSSTGYGDDEQIALLSAIKAAMYGEVELKKSTDFDGGSVRCFITEKSLWKIGYSFKNMEPAIPEIMDVKQWFKFKLPNPFIEEIFRISSS